MPISDLLASITGEKPKPSTASTTTTTISTTTKAAVGSTKRKADDDLSGSAQKSQRTVPLGKGSVKPGDGAASAAPRPADRPAYTGSAGSRSTVSQTNSNKPSAVSLARKPMVSPSKPSPTSAAFSHGSRPSVLNSPSAARPNNISPPKPGTAGATVPKAQPKKGSYAEIMARAKAAQATMGAVGKIQHKALDKVPTKREREELRAEQARGSKKGVKPQSTRPGHPRPGINGSGGLRDRDMDRHRDGGNSIGHTKDRKPVNGKSARAAEEDRKLKKAATATTGYTGTARPPPGASKAGSSSRATASNGSRDRHHDQRPYGAFSARRGRDDDYDEELDDFIEYDDEEPEYGGGRRGYGGYSDEEDESDMEAGLSDIDDEERKAEVYARQEDRREEELEKRLKREKEERKRRLLEGR